MKITHLDRTKNLSIQKNTTKNTIYFVLKNYLEIQEKGNIFITFFVTIIILGILLAIILPNLLSGCSGKPREAEGYNATQTLNRSQQAYHFKGQKFASNIQELAVKLPEGEYYNFFVEVTPTIAYAFSLPKNYQMDIRSYSGATFFDKKTNSYQEIVCETNENVKKPTKPILKKDILICQNNMFDMGMNGEITVEILNYRQTGYHVKNKKFASNIQKLTDTLPESQYYNFLLEANHKESYAFAIPKNYQKYPVRSYSGAIFFDKTINSYQKIICETNEGIETPTKPIFKKGILTCPATMKEVK